MKRALMSVLLVGWTCVRAAVAQPAALPPKAVIPTGPEAYTQAKFETEVMIPFYKRTVLDAYKQHGVHDPKWDDAATTFLEHVVTYEMRSPGALPQTELRDEGGRLVGKLKCMDPLVRLYFWQLQQDVWYWGQSDEAAKIPSEMIQCGYSAPQIAEAYEFAQMLMDGAGQPVDRVFGLLEESQKFWLEALRDPQNQGATQRVLYAIFTAQYERAEPMALESRYVASWSKFMDQLVTDASIDAWTKNILNGYWHIRTAWVSRGYGWANSVTPEGWLGFDEHIAKAQAHLRAAYADKPDRPEAASEMIALAGAGKLPKSETILFWFNRAVAAQMDYEPAYWRVQQFLLPRWGFDLNELVAFGEACAATKRYDTIVPMTYSSVVSVVERDARDGGVTIHHTVQYQKLLDIVKHMLDEPRFADDHRRLDSVAIALSAQLGDYAWANQKLESLGADRLRDETMTANLHAAEVGRIVPARGGPVGKLVLEGDAAFDKRDHAGAAAVYQKALDALPAGHAGRKYLHDRMQVIAWEKAYDAGERVDLSPNQDMDGWMPLEGTWGLDANGAIVGRVEEARMKVRLINLGRFSHRFEYTGQLDLDEAAKQWVPSAAPIFGYAMKPLYRFRTVIFQPSNHKMALRRDFAFGDFIPANVPYSIPFRIVVFDRLVRIYIGGQLMLDTHWLNPDEVFGLDEFVGCGASSGIRHKELFRFSHLHIRKLDALPAE
ncbi:MAG: hypothetical protein GC162_14300 [Planctomycetes bacterium]|nr:hypothetical protein [Planctomycetota bacterium]